MVSPSNISQRLQKLENLLEALTSEFRQLRQDFEVMEAGSGVSEKESVPPQPSRRFEADKETTLSEAFFSVESMEVKTQQFAGRGFEADKATMISESWFDEDSQEISAEPNRGFEADKATMISESWFEADSQEISAEPNRGFEADKATMISESWFEADSQEISAEPNRGFEADKATMLSDDLIYEELTDPGEWDALRQELEPGKETIAFDFPIEASKPVQAPQPTQPTSKPAQPQPKPSDLATPPTPKNLSEDPW